MTEATQQDSKDRIFRGCPHGKALWLLVTLTWSVVTAPAQTNLGTALSFNGEGQRVHITDFFTYVPTTEVTVEFWQNASGLKAQSSFSQDDSSRGGWDPQNVFNAHVPYSDGRVYWDFGDIGSAGRLEYTPPVSIVGTWQHFALVASQSGNFMRIYRNGILEAEKAGMTPFTRGSFDLDIGGENNYMWDVSFGGILDELRIWDVARSEEQIEAFMNRSLPLPQTTLVAYWPFDEGTGGVAHDASGHGQDGILVNGPQWYPPDPHNLWIEANCTNVVVGYAVLFTARDITPVLQTVWDFGDGTTVTNQLSVMHSWSTPGLYTVGLTGYCESYPAGVNATVTVHVVEAPDCVLPPLGMVAWWPGEGNADDILGGHHGALEGPASFATGVVGQAFNLRESPPSYIRVEHSADLDLTNVTVEAWVRLEYLTCGWRRIVHKPGPQLGPDDFDNYELAVTGTCYPPGDLPGGFSYAIFAVCDGSRDCTTWSTTKLDPGVWYHLAGCYDDASKTAEIYVNGVEERAVTEPLFTHPVMPDRPLYLGFEPYWSSVLPGQIDEVSIYNRALSAAEIQLIYAAGSAGKCHAWTTNAAPVIMVQPTGKIVCLGDTTQLRIIAWGTPPLAYQWRKDGVPLNARMNTTLTLTNATLADTGDYAVVVTNGFGSVTSAIARVTVIQRPIHYVAVDSANPLPPYTSWATAATNIQDAVDAAVVPGSLVLVSNGVYAVGGRAVVGTTTNRVAVDKLLMVRSVNGPEVTVIEGDRYNWETGEGLDVRCVYLVSGASLSGFTLTSGGADYGGGVSCESATAVVSNCTLNGNSAGWVGGGGAYGGTLEHCTLTSNQALIYGGGVYGSTLKNCVLTSNMVTFGWSDTPLCGGGAYESTLANCVLTGNAVGGYGFGGGACGGTLYNCTLTGNSAGWGGGGGGGAGYSTLNNCIVYFNTVEDDWEDWYRWREDWYETTLNYCCTTPGPWHGVGNISNAPLFVDTNGWRNLRLRPDSPCIDAGTNLVGLISTDLLGLPRPMDGNGDGIARVDMGAYEFNPYRFEPTLHLSASGFQFTVCGEPGRSVRIERIDDLVHWEFAGQVPIPIGGQTLIDPAATTEPYLFYRAVRVP